MENKDYTQQEQGGHLQSNRAAITSALKRSESGGLGVGNVYLKERGGTQVEKLDGRPWGARHR